MMMAVAATAAAIITVIVTLTVASPLQVHTQHLPTGNLLLQRLSLLNPSEN